MKNWEKEAIEWIEKSLKPFPQEMNEIDWKLTLSDKSERTAQHLSAFSNYPGGGFLIYGIENGVVKGIDETSCSSIVQTLGNIARQNLQPPIIIDHTLIEYMGKPLLVVSVDEAHEKPVHVRSGSIYDSYIRSAGQTRRLDRQEVVALIAQSQTRFEDGIAKTKQTAEDVLRMIDFTTYFDLSDTRLPSGNAAILDVLIGDKLVRKNGDLFDIMNLGAILFAKNIEQFDNLARKAVRLIIYEGNDRTKTKNEVDGKKGYAAGFESLINFINNVLPTNEVIKSALREDVKMYPEIAIRELVANALIHQDFYMTGTGPMIEIFSERIEITNPGSPLVQTLRLLDAAPQSRNEKLASIMRRLKVCEERGSGIDKVVFQTELFQLPAPDFVVTNNHFKATLFGHRNLTQMNKSDKVRACYLHCCLKYVSGDKMNNSSLRDRFQISDKNYPIASNIISDTVETGLIKVADPTSKSKRYSYYIPFWA